MQEVVYLKYLYEVKRFSKGKCYEEWIQLKNGTAQLWLDPYDEEQLKITFDYLFDKLNKKRYKDINCSRRLKPIKIFKEEIDFLNSLKCPLWTKKYWACLLVYYKFQVQNKNRVEKSKTLNAWAIRKSTNLKTPEYGMHCQDRITRYRIQSNENIIKDYPKMQCDMYPTYYPAFIKDEGTKPITCKTIDEIDNILYKLSPGIDVCPECHCEFEHTRRQTNLCPDCYKKSREEYQKEYKKEYMREYMREHRKEAKKNIF